MKSGAKRWVSWALTLALVLGLVPGMSMTAYAADTYSLYVGGVEITSENLTVNGDSGTATYDPASHTLTLDNYSYTGAGYGDSEGGGIDYRGGTDLTIVLNGSNSIVKSSVSTPDRSHGIYFCCSGKTLTISGEGSLDISFQSASSGIWKRNGIFCEPGAFVLESGTVSAAGGTADESAGIYTNSGITINGGTFTGIGNPTTAYESRGIYSGSITVNGGKAIGRATNTDKTAYAFQGKVTVNGGELTASASTDSGEAKAFSWDSCEVAGELLEMRVGDSEETATATTNADDVAGKKYVYIKAEDSADPASAVASVTPDGGTVTEYGTLSDALNAWTDGSTLTLLDDVTTANTISVTGTKTLDLNGHGITKTGGENVIWIQGGNLTVNDSNATTTHYFNVDSGKAVNVNATEGAQSFSGGYITGGTGKYFDGYFGEEGGGVYVDGGSFTLNGGTILGNSVNADNGSGVGIYSGTMTMNGGTICYNKGHGVAHRSGSSGTNRGGGATTTNFVMYGGVIANNTKNGVISSGWWSYGVDSDTFYGGTIINNGNWGIEAENLTIAGSVTVSGNANGVGFSSSASISGSPTIYGNTNNNLKVNNGKTIDVSGELTNTTPIGVTMQTPGVFTNSGNTDCNNASKFTSDNTSYAVGKNASGQLFLDSPVTVTFDANGHGTAPDSMAVVNGSTITEPSAPTETGYDFGGWYKDADCTEAWDFSEDTVTEDTTLYAKWTLAQYTVTVENSDNGTVTADKSTAQMGETVTLTAAPDAEYELDTLAVTDDDSNSVTVNGGVFTMPASNVTVSAAFRAKPAQTITADDVTATYGDTGRNVTASTDGGGAVSYAVTSGDAVTVDASTGALTILKAGTATVTVTAAGSDSYRTTTKDVTVTVSRKALTVTAAAQSKTYGKADPELTFTASGFADGDSESVITGALSRDAGEDAGEYDITQGTLSAGDNYEVNYIGADMTINKRAVTLTSATDSKVYDGAALTNSEVTVSGDGWAADEGATYSVTGSQTLPGSSENAFTYTLNEGTKAENYEIETVNGTLTVTNRTSAGDEGDTTESRKYEITLSANSGEFLYDGRSHSVSGFETLEFTFNNVTYTVSGLSAEVTGTDAGTYPVTVTGTAVVKDSAGDDLTAQFIVNTADGSLTINKRSVTLISTTDSKPYDGNALTNDTVTATGDGFVDGEGAEYDVTGSQRTVGSSANTFTYTLSSGTKADNYTITTSEGTLTVTSRDAKYEISPQSNSDSVKYDGQAHTVSGFVTDSFTVEGNTYTLSGLTASATGTNAGTYMVSVDGTAVVTDSDGNDVSGEFSVMPQTGTLAISKREVTLTSATAAKEYDGTALTDDTVTVGGDGFADGEGAAYSVTGTRTLVGASENTFTYTLNEGTLADNYTITTSNGNLTVTNRNAKYTVTLTANSGEFLYDGAEKTVSGWTIDGAEGGTFTASNGLQYTVSGMTAETVGTDAGTYTVNVTGTAVVKDSGGNDVTDQFAVSTESGTLKINKRSVTLTSGSLTRAYNGAALTSDEVTVCGDGFASGEGAAYIVTGSQILPGSSANAFTYTLNEGTKAGNYEITTVNGTLTVTNRTSAGDAGDTTESRKYEITLTANSGEFLYDGTEHSVSGFETLEYTFGGVTYTVSGVEASAKATNAGEMAVVITGTPVVKMKDSGETDLAAQFIVSKVDGKLTITKATPEYTVPTGLTAVCGDTLSDVSLPSGWTWDTPSASVGDAGTSTFSVTFTPSDTGNYNTVTETVSVTVNKAAPDAGQLPYAVTGLVYDGAAHTLVIGGSSDDGVYYYRLGTDGPWSEALPSASEAGNYTIYYYLAGDTNHLDLGGGSAPLGSVSTAIASPGTPVISGKVLRTDDEAEIGGATVRLVRGSEETASTVTATDGSYQLAAEPGLYNIVVEWTNSVETLTKTEMITVSGDTTKDVAVLSGSVSSVLEVMPETPGVIVGGLDAEAQAVQAEDGGSVVTVRMVVERSADDADTSAIQSAAAGQDLDSFEIRVEKTVDSVTTPLTQTMTVLELVIPCSFGGKENVRSLRVHDGTVSALTESASGEDGTFWLDKANSFIHVYANQFSTYAVAYTQCYNITGAIVYGDYTGTVTVSLVERGGETPAASREISLSGGMGAYSFTHIPKGTYTITASWLDGETETTLNKEIEVR